MSCKCSFPVFPVCIMMVLIYVVKVTGDKSVFPDQYSAPQQQYSAPQDQYSAPQQQYSAPQDQYSAPQQQYSAPQDQYSAPQQQYSAPQDQYSAPQQQYSAPQDQYGQVQHTSSGVKPFKFSFWAVLVVFKFLFFALLFILYQITYVGNYTQTAKPLQPAPPKGDGSFRNSNISVLTRQFLKQLLEGDFDINKLIEKSS